MARIKTEYKGIEMNRQKHSNSNPATPTRKRQVSTETCRFQLYSPYGELYAPLVRDICFASDMPAGVSGEYNITKSEGFYITFCESKIYHSVEDGISLKTNG